MTKKTFISQGALGKHTNFKVHTHTHILTHLYVSYIVAYIHQFTCVLHRVATAQENLRFLMLLLMVIYSTFYMIEYLLAAACVKCNTGPFVVQLNFK